MRHWLITNTRAGNGSRGEAYWRPRLERAGITRLRVRDIGDPAWEAALEPEDIVLVAGGDGSVNRVARVCLERDATLGVLPSGTANDFARNLALPATPDALCRLMARAPRRRIDVGWIGDRLFLNVVHVGLGSLPATHASSRHKRWLGRFSYAAILPQLRRLGLHRGFHAEIRAPGGCRYRERWLSIAIASGTYFGGGQPVPFASPHDGRLTLVAIRPRAWWQLLGSYLRVRLGSGRAHQDDSMMHLEVETVRLALHSKHQATADGESLGRVDELVLRAQPDALRVIAAG